MHQNVTTTISRALGVPCLVRGWPGGTWTGSPHSVWGPSVVPGGPGGSPGCAWSDPGTYVEHMVSNGNNVLPDRVHCALWSPSKIQIIGTFYIVLNFTTTD